jgi:PAS domain S-box-containing protein
VSLSRDSGPEGSRGGHERPTARSVRDPSHRDPMPDALLVVDRDGRVHFATPSISTYLAMSSTNAVGRLLDDVFHGDETSALLAVLAEGAREPGRRPVETVRIPPLSDDARMLEVDCRSTGSGDGLFHILTIRERQDSASGGDAGRDVERASDALTSRHFGEHLTGDFVSTPDGCLLACNGAFASILGCSSVAEALSANTVTFYADPQVREELLERLRAERSLKRFELELRRRDGRSIHVIVNAIGRFADDDTLEAIQGNLFDITEQRRLAEERTQLLVRERAAREVAEAAQRQAAFLAEVGGALDSALDYRKTLANLARLVVPTLGDYCLIDERTPDGGSRRVAVAHVDPEMEALLLPDEENPGGADCERHPVMKVIREGMSTLVSEVSGAELDVIAHDGSHREVLESIGIRSYMIVPLVARGRTLGALTLVSSSSGRRFTSQDVELAEAVARRAALSVDNARLYSRAQQAARTREEVLAFVSHDLRNPLATILLNASALLETIPSDRLDADEREQLEWIARSSEQMNRMIQDLLDVARIESGQLPIRLARTSMRSVVNEAAALLQPQVREENLLLDIEGVPERLEIELDRERVLRVLLNLIGNAIRFTPGGGRIRVEAEILGGSVRIAVRDTGVGIASDEGARLFEPYWQGRRPGPGRSRGNGLGLAIAKGIVEAHGGAIWFESEPDVGTSFYFTLPTRRHHELTPDEAPATVPG